MKNTGFSLLELMVVVAILSLLTAIAVPNYRNYVVTNAEKNASGVLLQAQIDAERWRSKALNYRGFGTLYGTDLYTVTVFDASSATVRPALNAADAVGTRWVAFARPTNDNEIPGARYLLFSDGDRCKLDFGLVGYATFDQTQDCSVAGVQAWDE